MMKPTRLRLRPRFVTVQMFLLLLSCPIGIMALTTFPLSSSSSSSSSSSLTEQRSEPQPLRRTFLVQTLSSIATTLLVATESPPSTQAAVTDETDTFGDNWWTKKDGTTPTPTPTATRPLPANNDNPLSSSSPPPLDDDEVMIRITKQEIQEAGGSLGIELGEVSFRNNLRVVVKSVLPNSLGAQKGISKNYVLVSLNGQSTEQTNAQGVVGLISQILKQADKDDNDNALEFQFRDPGQFRQSLSAMSKGSSVTTQIAPSGTVNQGGQWQTLSQDQKYTVTQLVAPPKQCTVGAKTDDLLEISYVGTVLETGQIFDGSAVQINGQGIPGRGNDVTLYFVLGKLPMGQFPPGWDTGLYGMCVGERRRLLIPPILAYGSTGLPRRGIPPEATLQYDITLVSVNGLSVVQ
ncbi:hypothetical protein ACA910_021338 [Epithemia clementina (nom. ined.)]